MQSINRPVVETDVPARLDRLPWSRFHYAGRRRARHHLGARRARGHARRCGLRGAHRQPVAALHRGAGRPLGERLSRRRGARRALLRLARRPLGRRRLFFVTLGVYIAATGATALAGDFWTFMLFRFLTGAGIGGEYAAINSAIQELIPARYRGRTDLAINGSFWLGALCGAIGSTVLLDPSAGRPTSVGARRSDRRGARPRRAAAATYPAREPALAVHARARRGGRRGGRRHRGARVRSPPPTALPRLRIASAPRRASSLARPRHRACSAAIRAARCSGSC